MKRTDVDLETQLAEAEQRRKTMEEERIKKLSELSGLNKIEKVIIFSSFFLTKTYPCLFAGKSRSNKATGSEAGGCYAAKKGTIGKHEVVGIMN